MSEYEAIERRREPNTRASLARELRALGVGAGDARAPLIVHASLSRLGWVCGGAVATCQAIIDAAGAEADVVMPAQTTEYSDPSLWTAPPVPEAWWPIIRAEMPLFDPEVAPTRQMGAIAEAFRRWPGSRRSSHPSVSFAARGPRAEAIVGAHPLTPAFGEGSPLGRLYEMDARILLLGTEYDACTAMHLAEARFAGSPSAANGAPQLDPNGAREWREYVDVKYDADRFLWIGHDYEKRAPKGDVADLRIGFVGNASARFLRMRPLVDYALAWLEKRDALA